MARGAFHAAMAFATVLLLLVMAVPATANHAQYSNGPIAIVHKGGNEWWVEAHLVGYSKTQVTKVEARDDDTAWTALALRSWGNWAGSLHIEPGHAVHFRVTTDDGSPYGSIVVWSCAFTHPTGQEKCGQGYPYGAEGVVLFDHTGGDASSVRLNIEPHGGESISTALARVEGTTDWTVMQRGSDTEAGNPWSLSLAVPTGLRVQFQAYQSGSMSDVWRDTSCMFTHPAGIEQCGGTAGPGMVTDYSGISYALGVVQVKVDSSKQLLAVEARIDPTASADDESAWIALDSKGSGMWGKAIQIPNGAYVQFRTRAYDGSFDVSDNAWQAPGMTLKPAASTAPFTVEFRNIKGGTDWVQVNPVVNKPIGAFFVREKAPGQPDYNGTLHALWPQSWGARAGPIHVPSGHIVKFESVGIDGVWQETEWMAWPPASSVTPPPPPGTFDATFTGVRGNEWWEQASVSATGGTLAKVDVSLNGGTWKALAKQSWGGYAASYRAVEGTSVQFRATSSTGATDLSDCYRWIPAPNTDATKVTCGTTPPPPPPPTGFDAQFTGVKGNNWWVQASVSANQALAGVDARVNCSGDWKPLTKQSYGWAASFNVPSGSKVDFRASSTSGATDLSGGYVWTQATPTSAC